MRSDVMKKGILISIGLLMVILYINGCGINNRVDPGLENDAGGRFHAHDHQRGEGFGFWNQQRDPKNPIASIVTRDERPGRGMNGIVDRRPNEMNRRLTRFQETENQHLPIEKNNENNDIQLRLEILQMNGVRDVTIISHQDRLLVAVETETPEKETLKNEIVRMAEKRSGNKQVVVITDRRAVDRIRLLDDGFRTDNLNDPLDNTHGPIVGQH